MVSQYDHCLLDLLFVGGAFGKLLCGYLGARIGLLKTVWLTESATAALIAPRGRVLGAGVGTAAALGGTVTAAAGGYVAPSTARCFAQLSRAGRWPSALTRSRTGPVNDRRCPASRK